MDAELEMLCMFKGQYLLIIMKKGKCATSSLWSWTVTFDRPLASRWMIIKLQDISNMFCQLFLKRSKVLHETELLNLT